MMLYNIVYNINLNILYNKFSYYIHYGDEFKFVVKINKGFFTIRRNEKWRIIQKNKIIVMIMG